MMSKESREVEEGFFRAAMSDQVPSSELHSVAGLKKRPMKIEREFFLGLQ